MLQVPTTQLAKMSIKIEIRLTADVLENIFIKCADRYKSH